MRQIVSIFFASVYNCHISVPAVRKTVDFTVFTKYVYHIPYLTSPLIKFIILLIAQKTHKIIRFTGEFIMKIVCIGDSFTKGFGVNKSECWFGLLEKSSSHIFINKGINGDTTGGMLARFRTDVIEEKPNYVLITGGINDFISGGDLSSVQPNIMSMVHQSFDNGILPILGIEPQCVPAAIRSDWASFTNFHDVYKKHEKFHMWLLDFGKTFGADCIDFYSEFLKIAVEKPLPEYFMDGLHFTKEGHRLIYEIAHNYFNQ